MRYRWLPTWNEVPKHLHENPLLSHLEELEVKMCIIFRRNFVAKTSKWREHTRNFCIIHFQMMSALQNVFAYLQKLAAGLELVVEDQIDNNGPFHREFFEAQYELKAVSIFSHGQAPFQLWRAESILLIADLDRLKCIFKPLIVGP